MTEYELEDLLTGIMSLTIDLGALHITVVVMFLVAVYLAGNRLTSGQATTVSVVFVVATVVTSWGAMTLVGRAIPIADALEAINPGRQYGAQPILKYAVGIVTGLSVVACLKFMWEIRHSGTD